MRNVKTLFIVVAVAASLMLSACHGSGGTAKMRWVNQADAQQVMEFSIQSPSIGGRIHMTIMGTRLRGSYTVKNGAELIDEGKLTVDSPGYLLKSKNGQEEKLTINADAGFIEGTNGTKWKLDNPPMAATLRKW